MKRQLLMFFGTLVALFAPAAAFAQEGFQPMNEAARTRMDANPFILAAYGFIWVAILLYVVFVARGLGRARNEIEELRRKVERS